MDSSLVQLSPAILVTVPVIMGLTQLIKNSNFVGARYVPILCVALSVLAAFVVTDASWQQTLIQGLSVGLMSIGAFAGTRSTFQG